MTEYGWAKVSAWDAEWTRLGQTLVVPHPQYPSQRHRFDQYSVKDSKDEVVVFAAGEYSNGVWGFFERT